ncbi:MAG TPA: Yip1 family protein [Allosphingosinicella sp.]|nr:Yip1 family protein [Allosphingosinicella sp.]
MDDATPPSPAPAGSSPQKGLIERVMGILLKPKSEWGVIESEASTVQSIYVPYVVLLAAIGPIASIIGQQVIGINYGGFRITMPVGYTVTFAVLTFGLQLAGVYVCALIIDALAPTFKGTKNFLNAFKVAAYSFTAAWLAGIFNIVPQLAFLGLVGLYSFYLLYLGLPRLMKTPEDQSIGYVGVTVFAMIVVWGVIMVLVSQLAWAFFTPTMTLAPGSVTFS